MAIYRHQFNSARHIMSREKRAHPFVEVAGHPVILLIPGRVFEILPPVTPVHFSAQTARAAGPRDLEALVISRRHDGRLAIAGMAFDSEFGRINIGGRFKVIHQPASPPTPRRERAPVTGLTPVSLTEQTDQITGEVGPAAVWLEHRFVVNTHAVTLRARRGPWSTQEKGIEITDTITSTKSAENNKHRHRAGRVRRQTQITFNFRNVP